MDETTLLMDGLSALPERVEKLEKTVFEQRILIGMLLRKSGLDTEGIDKAFTLAQNAREEIIEKLSTKQAQAWAQTPEGQESIRRNEEARRQRLKQLWREDCVEEGKILPDPTI
jgi:hypothetical protein